jgi:hypothetical protein
MRKLKELDAPEDVIRAAKNVDLACVKAGFGSATSEWRKFLTEGEEENNERYIDRYGCEIESITEKEKLLFVINNSANCTPCNILVRYHGIHACYKCPLGNYGEFADSGAENICCEDYMTVYNFLGDEDASI